MNEEWRDIKGYEKMYQVSNFGDVRSVTRRIKSSYGKSRCIKGKILRKIKGSHGYFTVCLSKNGKVDVCLIHREVASAFLPKKEGYNIVNHIDGCKINNDVRNIEWSTYSLNNKHAYDTGLKTNDTIKTPVIGVNKINGQVLMYDSMLQSEKFGFDNRQVSKCCKGKVKTHKGYKWSKINGGTI